MARVGASDSNREFTWFCPISNEENDIVVSSDKFASDAEDGVDGDGKPVWPMFSETCVFNSVFKVGMLLWIRRR